MKRLLAFFSCWVVCLFTNIPLNVQAADRPPNIVFLLVDDWGWTDASNFGSDLYQTPNIDQLADQSVLFTQAYAACTVCSPTRAAILTGQYPARLHLTDWIKGHQRPLARLQVPDWTQRLEFRHTTIAEMLKDHGYKTAHLGKWHLAPVGRPEVSDYYPEQHGFDVNIGGNEWGQPGSYFHPYTNKNGQRRVPLEGGQEGEYLTDRLTREAMNLMDLWQDRPFFIHLAYYNVHTPLQAKGELITQYRTASSGSLRHKNPVYAAMVESVDQSVGRLQRHLRTLGLHEDTVIILTGDNGGLTLYTQLKGPTNNFPLREGKGHVYEGGTRVPLMISWPSRIQAVGRKSKEPVISVDFFPTIAAMAGIDLSRYQDGSIPIDGVNLMPLLEDPQAESWNRESLFWHYPHYHPGGATPYSAIRKGDWKYIHFYETDQGELYNLERDMGERKNIADQEVQRVSELKSELQTWLHSVKAQLPLSNPNHDPVSDR